MINAIRIVIAEIQMLTSSTRHSSMVSFSVNRILVPFSVFQDHTTRLVGKIRRNLYLLQKSIFNKILSEYFITHLKILISFSTIFYGSYSIENQFSFKAYPSFLVFLTLIRKYQCNYQYIFVKFLTDTPFALDDCACYIESMINLYIYLYSRVYTSVQFIFAKLF